MEKNIFSENNKLSNIAKFFLSGVLRNAKALTFLTNPTANSYKRFVKGYEAPVKICWGYHDRSAMIRVPKASVEATRIEMRSPDAMMNPYLGLTGILRAGLEGINNKDVWEKDKFSELLPSNIEEARIEFKKSKLLASMAKQVLCLPVRPFPS